MPTHTLYCPLDGVPMTERPHGRESFHQCWQCSGIWVSRMLMHGLCHRSDASLAGSLTELPPPVRRGAPIHCPGCNYLMARRIHHDVQIDTCPECRAAWLDGGEIIHIGDRLKADNRARQRTLERKSKNPLTRPVGIARLEDGKNRAWSLSGGILDAVGSLLGELLD